MDYEFTLSPELPALPEHPFYKAGMTQIAAGQWPQAFQSFQLLQGIYPDDAEVKELLNQVQMRAALARFQPRHSSRVTKRRSGRRIMIGVLVTIVVTLAAYGAYEVWISPLVVQEFRLRQITDLRNEADEAMVAGNYAQARQSLQRLQAILPGDTQTIETLHRIEQVERLSTLYDEAKAFMAAGSWDQAMETLTELQSLDAEYRDLPQLLQVAQESQALDRQFQAAEEDFARSDWASAIARYETLKHANLTFRFEEIQARLFDSHLKYGQTLLEEAGTDPSQISEATSHFSEALKLRPIDAEALNERRLAETYLTALDSREQDEAIDLLEMIYNEQPAYAGRQVAHLLYAALLERADSFLKAGDEAAAVSDYRVAARLLVEDPSEAQEKLAELASEVAPQ